MVNSGAITARTGIAVLDGGTIFGAIVDSGTIKATSHGILIDSASEIVSTKTAVVVTGRTLAGGILNGGLISGGFSASSGLRVAVSVFSGGINNTGVIAGQTFGLAANASRFAGGVSNTGTILGNGAAFLVRGSLFSGGVDNTGMISGGTLGVALIGPTFAGGLSNGGTILAHTGSGAGVLVAGAVFSAVGSDNTEEDLGSCCRRLISSLLGSPAASAISA